MKTDTPETDEAWASWPYAGPGMSVHVGRKLERERDEALRQLEMAKARIRDMLKGDDGQAWDEAERFLELSGRGQAGGVTDTQRLDWLQETLLSLHRQGPYMDGCNIGGQLHNKARDDKGLGGKSYIKVHHRTIRDAIDEAMAWGDDLLPRDTL